MNEFLNSKFIKDLSNSKLPVVEIKISNQTILELTAMFVFVGLALLMASKLIKNG